jgi:hypothetical protein
MLRMAGARGMVSLSHDPRAAIKNQGTQHPFASCLTLCSNKSHPQKTIKTTARWKPRPTLPLKFFKAKKDRIRWDEKAGLRRDAVGSQVIDALEAQEIKETGNEEG